MRTISGKHTRGSEGIQGKHAADPLHYPLHYLISQVWALLLFPLCALLPGLYGWLRQTAIKCDQG